MYRKTLLMCKLNLSGDFILHCKHNHPSVNIIFTVRVFKDPLMVEKIIHSLEIIVKMLKSF